jgi:hypothetical protein
LYTVICGKIIEEKCSARGAREKSGRAKELYGICV